MSGTLTKQTFYLSLLGTVKTTSMIILILVSASFLTMSMGFLNIPSTLASIVAGMQLSPGWLIFALTIRFVVLGFFLDGISVVLLTTAIVLPMV
jgi:TRAP-type C4-dicarboxylate transport system permease large subunit